MTLSASGLLSGTPSVAGSFSLVVSVTDSTLIPLVASATYAVTVTAPIITVTTGQLLPGVVNVPYPSVTLTATGGKAPYTWSFASGSLPAGLILDTTGLLHRSEEHTSE